MSRLLLRLVLVALPVGLAAQSPAPQGSTLRASVDQVVVDVVAVDRSGAPVTGLTAADFEILERGKPQAIATFSEVGLPFQLRPEGAPLPLRSDVRTNRDTDRRRLYTLVLDDENVSVALTAEVHRIAQGFVRNYVQGGDLVSVVTTSAFGKGQAEFTDDLVRVGDAISRFAGKRLSPSMQSHLERTRAGEHDRTRIADAIANDDLIADEQATGMLALRTLTSVVQSLASVDGRKAVLYASTGIPIHPGAWGSSEHEAQLRDLIDAAARANVTIYAFDPMGLAHHADIMRPSPGSRPAQYDAPGAERRARGRMLGSLAYGTGGEVFMDTNDWTPGHTRVASDSSHYYLLGYPQTGKRDGKFRAIEVRCKRPGVTVRSRRGYYAPDDKAQQRQERETRKNAEPLSPIARELSGIVGRAAWTGGVPLSAYAVALPGSQKNVRVVIEVAPGAVDAGTPDSGTELGFDLMILPVMTGGHVLPSVQSRVTLDATTIEDVRAHGVRLVEALTLPPDTYQLRIGVRDRRRGVAGSIFVDVEVADPKKAGLVMSDLVVGAKGAGRMPSATIDRQLTALLGGPPTASRTFDPGGTLRAYAEFADAGGGKDVDVALTTIIRDAADVELVRRVEPAATARATADRGLGYVIDLPLDGFAPGRYTLRVEGRAAGRNAPLAREVGFTVRSAGS